MESKVVLPFGAVATHGAPRRPPGSVSIAMSLVIDETK